MKLPGWFAGICLVLLIACADSTAVKENKRDRVPEAQPTTEATKPPIPIHISQMSSAELCDRLISIDTLPTHDPTITDPIYESLIAKEKEAITCLVEKITDKTPVPDPRYSVPHWQHYAVGDTAVFVLLRILSRDDDSKWEKLMTDNLPPKYKEEWETNGIYAYFNYVSEPRNRKELQNRWKKWLKENEK
jgi:hypothetical protein